MDDNPTAFPLFTILTKSSAELNGGKNKRPLTEWCGRALLEGTMINMSKFLDDGR